MTELKILYILLSILVGLFVVITLFVGFYTIKIFKNISDLINDFKEIITGLKNKTKSLVVFFANASKVLERFLKKEKDQKEEKEK